MTNNPRVRQSIPILEAALESSLDSRFDKEELDVPETGPPAARPPFVVRAGDLLQVADTTRLALVVAESATDLLDQRGDMPKTVASLRAQIAALRGS